MRVVAICVLLTATIPARAEKRALLIGINDYSASRFTRVSSAPDRGWADLNGALNDVDAMRQMLVLRYEFEARNIVTLTDQVATRATILRSVEQHLVRRARKGDILLFYFAGHGSQVRNTLSDEPDRMDESIVPADSRAGARDIRDKELRPLFNAILDRGARLTVILDNCHSGSGARGLATGALPRGIESDLRDVADRARTAHPEDRGALILSAAQDFDRAWETRDEKRELHGAFSLALIRAMRVASPTESASETFLRAQARLRSGTPFQDPVIAGSMEARQFPLLGTRSDARDGRPVVFVEKMRRDGVLLLQGGWAHGLSVGSQLRAPGMHLVITKMLGLGRSEARIESGSEPVQSGARLEVAGWGASATRPLRVRMPRISSSELELAALARKLKNETARRGVRWIDDPLDAAATHQLRHTDAGWELLASGRVIARGHPMTALAKLRAGSSLFVQFPVPAVMIDRIDIESHVDADYTLVGRYANRHLEYAWVRPAVASSVRRKSALPLRTAWVAAGATDSLRDAIECLRRLHGWMVLESPVNPGYRLALRRLNDGAIADRVLAGGERYEIVLRAKSSADAKQRYVYVFVIDSHGEALLLFPRRGSVENRLPVTLPAPQEIALGRFEVAAPYGMDTWFLLMTDEPLPNPWILEWDGVRSRLLPSEGWSIERTVYESVPRR